ncbi:unnamed protein product [Mytilus coruscus]|uniref:Reverse transcriptase/retrotransposon-derived protein RNase H-like domain-containing protein n=1 Tax=Mytilus coruscus TaxID=42192 RepID=A0A6J8AJV8_MYTCO|nr:unnamed protein product [Mytilus coruscus]
MEDTSEEEYSEDEFLGSTVNHLRTVKKINVHKIGDKAITVPVMMNDVQVKREPDNCKAPESKEVVRSFLGMIGCLSKFIPRYTVLTAPLRELTKKEVKFKWGKQENEAFKKLKDSITDEKKMTFFDPKRPIIVRTEASYHEGLSAGLFQRTAKGLQPVHFISRSMTDTEKR